MEELKKADRKKPRIKKKDLIYEKKIFDIYEPSFTSDEDKS